MNRRIDRSLTADWPVLDRSQWEKGVAPKDLFESGGAGADWSEHSRRKTACGYSRWLSWLSTQGLLDLDSSPPHRVTQERVAAYVAHLRVERAPYTVLCRVQELYDALRVLAPDAEWGWLRRLYNALKAQVRPTRDKVSRLRSIDELAALGERLMEEAELAARWSARRRAVAYRDGLMIALLAYRPVRLKNFAMMRLGRHLTRSGACWRILFGADETKSHVAYEALLPSALVPHLERYLAVHRPVLLRGECISGAADARPIAEQEAPIDPALDAVWVSEAGTGLEEGALARRIVDQTQAAFGRSIPPHWFRDAAATSIAIDNPRHIGDASLVLGHAGPKTTEKHYNHARSLEASRRHADTLARLRGSLSARKS